MSDSLGASRLWLAALVLAAVISGMGGLASLRAQEDRPAGIGPAATAPAEPAAPAGSSGRGGAPAPRGGFPGAEAVAGPAEPTIREALVSLPIAALLGAVLAFRPQRRGTPPRSPAVIQTQIILSIVGTVVMLVVGASLARAFGIVGAASLVRYRSKIDDPKDAGVMLSCLGVGLATGVGIYGVAAISTFFILAVVWLLESQEPASHKDFLLRVKAKETGPLQQKLEDLLGRSQVKHEMRSSARDELVYSVKLPLTKRTDELTDAVLALGQPKDEMAVEWGDKKEKGDK
jgi:uncharacterized membrane protein YhiD involved in acid resistance